MRVLGPLAFISPPTERIQENNLLLFDRFSKNPVLFAPITLQVSSKRFVDYIALTTMLALVKHTAEGVEEHLDRCATEQITIISQEAVI